MKAKVLLMSALLGLTAPALAQTGSAQPSRVPASSAPVQSGRAAPTATAPRAATAQAAMQQFCQDLSTKGWQQAMGNMAGVSEREVTQAFHLMGGDDATLKIAEHVFKQSRCEVLSAQGARVRVKASGADIMTVLERVMNDPAVQRYLGQRQTAKADADLERTVLQSMQRQYQSGRLPLYTQTLNVDLERLDSRWTLTEDSLEALLDVLGGGPSRLEE